MMPCKEGSVCSKFAQTGWQTGPQNPKARPVLPGCTRLKLPRLRSTCTTPPYGRVSIGCESDLQSIKMAYTEEEPLLKPQAQQVTGDVALVQPEAQWDSGLLACCGNGDLQGCATFSLVHVFPCVAFGGCLSISPRISRATTLVKNHQSFSLPVICPVDPEHSPSW